MITHQLVKKEIDDNMPQNQSCPSIHRSEVDYECMRL